MIGKEKKRFMPIEAHHLFFMAAMGPILPQIFVFGKQLNIPADIMGYVACVIPIVYVSVKLIFNLLGNYFEVLRKFIFVLMSITMTLGFGGFYFIPHYTHNTDVGSVSNVTTHGEYIHYYANEVPRHETRDVPHSDKDGSFWMFVILLCLGTVGFNVTKSITDAIFSDLTKPYNEAKHWSYRTWGAIGFGVTALLGGSIIHFWTTGTLKSFTPALFVMVASSVLDLFNIHELKVPQFSSSSLFRDSCNLLRERKVIIFLGFATMVGVLDSFINFFIFWHLEDIAEETGYMGSIKLIEGCVIAAGCLCGELMVLLHSDRILKNMGCIGCLKLCFFLYAIRLLLIALIPSPWWFVAVELGLRGCTHTLTSACLRTYGSKVVSPETSESAQELGAGMKNRLGYIIGPLIGGYLYKNLGGLRSFLVFCGIAIVAFVYSIFLPQTYKKEGRSLV